MLGRTRFEFRMVVDIHPGSRNGYCNPRRPSLMSGQSRCDDREYGAWKSALRAHLGPFPVAYALNVPDTA